MKNTQIQKQKKYKYKFLKSVAESEYDNLYLYLNKYLGHLENSNTVVKQYNEVNKIIQEGGSNKNDTEKLKKIESGVKQVLLGLYDSDIIKNIYEHSNDSNYNLDEFGSKIIDSLYNDEKILKKIQLKNKYIMLGGSNENKSKELIIKLTKNLEIYNEYKKKFEKSGKEKNICNFIKFIFEDLFSNDNRYIYNKKNVIDKHPFIRIFMKIIDLFLFFGFPKISECLKNIYENLDNTCKNEEIDYMFNDIYCENLDNKKKYKKILSDINIDTRYNKCDYLNYVIDNEYYLIFEFITEFKEELKSCKNDKGNENIKKILEIYDEFDKENIFQKKEKRDA